MDIAVIGANGGIGREVVSRLAAAGHDPIGIVRDEAQFEAVRERGGEPRLGDLEGTFAPALDGADGVVFTAGAGGNTGWDKTLMIDLWGARRVIDACVEHGVGRFVMVSSRGAGEPLGAPEAMRPYLVAKRCADDALEAAPLDATILRPTTLTDDAETGHVSTAFESTDEGGNEIPRADVAQAIVACLDTEATVGETIWLFGGDTPIGRAVDPIE
jgi:nucleoside-diphosphate-sugar epimerase